MILNKTELIRQIEKWRLEKKNIVFTNGCFDLLHRGHVEYLQKAKNYGDVLVVGINSDSSVKRLKGVERPFLNQEDRSFIISSLISVDVVCIFDEDTPYELIKVIQPDVLIKGGDYNANEIVGNDLVVKNGGQVLTVPFVQGKSTSNLIKKIQSNNN